MLEPIKAIKKHDEKLEELKLAWIDVGRNQVLYLLLCLADENAAHDNWNPQKRDALIEARMEIVKRLKHPTPNGVMNNVWPREWPDFEKYTYCPG